MDLDLELDAEEVTAFEAEGPAADDGADALDLSDLEDLVGSGAETELEGEAVEALDDTDLDLSDLDDIIDAKEEPAQADRSAEGSDDPDLDLDLEDEGSDDPDLDLDLEAEPTTEEPILESSADLNGTDELDLSDLDGLMESDETPAEAAAIEEVGDDLELDFEVDESAAETAAVETAETPDQLDMPDLEKMLESDETPTSEGTEELDLDLDLDLETEGAVEASMSPEEQPPSDDAEFLDIEKMLEVGEDTASAEGGAEETLELDLEAVMDEAAQPKEPELELNLDLGDDMVETESALDISESAEDDLEFNLLGSDEETLQFGATQAGATQIDEGLAGETELEASDDDFASGDFAETQDVRGDTDLLDQAGAGISAPVRKKRTRKPVLAAVLLLVLCVVGYIVTQNLGIKIPFVSDLKIPYLSDVKIPFLSGSMKSEDKDVVGNLKITPMGKTITHKFIENTAAGDIFVIVGQVRNEYDHPRSYIKITGKLYRKGKALAKTATVYGGNMLSDSDLARLDMAAINKRLQNRFGDNRSNIEVKTGKTLPFLLVFSKLPANMDEYTVEVSGSSS
jgi:predicted secreted protein